MKSNSTTKTRAPKKAKAEQVQAQLAGLRLLGEVITWDAHGPHPFSRVKQALSDCNLDPKLARERLPQHAFTRAARSMEEERLIEAVRDDGQEIVFQFTKRHVVSDTAEGGEQLEYRKEAKVRLDKSTGKITCKNAEIQAKAQAELDRHLDERTTGDITTIVQRLFREHADLIPLRQAGGAYFVPILHQALIVQVHEFLQKLGGRINRFPVPEGTQYGDQAVQASVEDYLGKIIEDHAQAVKNLGVFTRGSSIEEAAEKINATRVKVEAYAQYLQDRKEALLEGLKKVSEDLVRQVDLIAGQKQEMEEKAKENGHAGSGEKDKFGGRDGTQVSLINKAVLAAGKAGVTAEDVATAIGGNIASVRSHFKTLLKKGLVVQVGERVRVK